VWRGSLALAGPEAEPAWAAERPAGAVHRNSGWASQRAVTRLVGPRGPDADDRAVVTLSGSSARVRRPVSGASVHACLSTRPASGVRCGRLRVQVSSVRRRCPVGVRCPCVPASMVSDRSGVVERGGGQAAAWLGWPGSAWVPVVSTTGSLSAQVGAWRSELAPAVLGQRRRRLGLGRRGGRRVGSGVVDRVADQERPDAREDRPSVGSQGRSEDRPPAAGCAACHPPPLLLRARRGPSPYPRRRARHRVRLQGARE
jgi:hypothetical protein